ncbi:hypothetical protein AG1IA_07362 [Rhizoctonia solani AG-1 IA]|uniref:Uncharacterized protein n=1 Tax=Thanatephorus cucumeris (strain AG1-IA) TaxID=983506 RepID=L8WQH5_THACA|nr:hypothetical protein AG1IA_07362 [Rhizoctonia solani AG-1 IA]
MANARVDWGEFEYDGQNLLFSGHARMPPEQLPSFLLTADGDDRCVVNVFVCQSLMIVADRMHGGSHRPSCMSCGRHRIRVCGRCGTCLPRQSSRTDSLSQRCCARPNAMRASSCDCIRCERRSIGGTEMPRPMPHPLFPPLLRPARRPLVRPSPLPVL